MATKTHVMMGASMDLITTFQRLSQSSKHSRIRTYTNIYFIRLQSTVGVLILAGKSSALVGLINEHVGLFSLKTDGFWVGYFDVESRHEGNQRK